jgi:hypothetical protein
VSAGGVTATEPLALSYIAHHEVDRKEGLPALRNASRLGTQFPCPVSERLCGITVGQVEPLVAA